MSQMQAMKALISLWNYYNTHGRDVDARQSNFVVSDVCVMGPSIGVVLVSQMQAMKALISLWNYYNTHGRDVDARQSNFVVSDVCVLRPSIGVC